MTPAYIVGASGIAAGRRSSRVSRKASASPRHGRHDRARLYRTRPRAPRHPKDLRRRRRRGFSPEVRPGEIVAVIGDNGSGTSTLVKISGVHPPPPGAITIDDPKLTMSSVTTARAHGIEVVHQDPVLADRQSVHMNLFILREPVKDRRGLLDRRAMISGHYV